MRILFLFLLVLFPAASLACQPTRPGFVPRSTEERVTHSSYVIIGKSNRSFLEGLWDGGYNYDTGEPRTTEIKVVHVLKGDLKEDAITVWTSFGMCGSAFLLPEGELRMMLLSPPHHDDREVKVYQPNGGYQDKPYIYFGPNEETGEYEVYESDIKDYISLEEFITKYDLNPLPHPLP